MNTKTPHKSHQHPLFPDRYGTISYGVRIHKYGDLLKAKDIVDALNYILDDETQIQARVETLLACLSI